MSSKVKVEISERSDGYGFLYGNAAMGDQSCIVNILPPASKWRRDNVLPGYEPDPESWIVFAREGDRARQGARRHLRRALEEN